jgi:hypothetical protein
LTPPNSSSPAVNDTLCRQAWFRRSVERTRIPARRALVLGDLEQCLAGSVFAKMMAFIRVELTADLEGEYAFAIRWAPWSTYQIPSALRGRIRTSHIVNDTHFHCDKSNVDRCYTEIFGESLRVDPATHEGNCVVKSERNAVHDGRVVACPVAFHEPGMVYQQLVDNRVEALIVEDLRVPVIGNQIPVVFLKYRPLEVRFSEEQLYAKAVAPGHVFTREERQLILGFSRRIGLDYGELDVLRDNATGKLRIVDANNTPFGPPRTLEPGESDLVISLMAHAFLEEFAR